MLAIVAAVIMAISIFLAIGHSPNKEAGDAATAGVRFEVVDGAHRELDGSPALALSFSLPLDSKRNYDKFVQVLEMPAAAAARPARNDGSVDDATEDDAEDDDRSAQSESQHLAAGHRSKAASRLPAPGSSATTRACCSSRTSSRRYATCCACSPA
jgi:hypothetical protein